MGTNIYMAVLGTVFVAAALAGMYQDIPLWLVWLLGILVAVGIGLVALTIFGARILRGDFAGGSEGEAGSGRGERDDSRPGSR